ncbi:MAG: nucleotide exchange factor GrpE [Candidatus Aminicenantes bacterium]|nr:nucleotide exchange factor GrpE [Candidatus Aminicenantes bacterium]
MVKRTEVKPAEMKEKEPKAKQDKAKILKDKLNKRESEIKLIKTENKRLKEEYLRKIAEMENLRKRLEREKGEFYQYALSELLKELFDVLDNFERALETQSKGNGKSFREGIEMIYKQYQDLLMKQGVKPIEIKEKKFDPHLHQAFITEESEDVEEPEVVEELQKGYTLHNRLLRPALVKVAVPKKS